MYIISKSAIVEEQLRETIRHCSKCEIQLFTEFENRNDCVDKLYSTIIGIDGLDVLCVHAPLIKGEELNIEYITNPNDYFMFEKTVVLASKLSQYYGHEVKVIFHTELAKGLYDKFPNLYEAIRKFMEFSLSLPGNLIICIENLIPFKVVKDKSIVFRNGVVDDNIYLVKSLREDLKSENIRTVLDTCHMLTSIHYVQKLFEDDMDCVITYSEEEYFKMNAPYVGLIHLSDVIGLGLRTMTHGIAFKEDRLNVMEMFMTYYKKYGYNCDVTLEIQENDYTNKLNLENNICYIKDICKRLEIMIEN